MVDRKIKNGYDTLDEVSVWILHGFTAMRCNEYGSKTRNGTKQSKASECWQQRDGIPCHAQLSSAQNLCWLIRVDYTTQYIGDDNNPIEGSL